MDTTGCYISEHCEKDVGDRGSEGKCQPKPDLCPPIWEPVYGCDDFTYANEFEAAKAGVTVQYIGECSLS